MTQNASKILVVDDEVSVVFVVKELLEASGYHVSIQTESRDIVNCARAFSPDLVLLDVNMPDTNGYEVCKRLKSDEQFVDVPVIFLSGMDAVANKIQGFSVGAVDYIAKPFDSDEMLARIKTHLRLRSLQQKLNYQNIVQEKIREISNAHASTIFALAKLAECRDEDTGEHLERVREYCRLLSEDLRVSSGYGEHITEEFIACIQHASPLHDIGKVAIPDNILLKPGRLTPEEFEVMKTHASIGGENLQMVYNNHPGNAFVGMGIEIALYHHERWDGKGYPDGLIGKNIPLSARIMSIADVYDALRSDRCYRKGMIHDEAMNIILEGNGTQFDPEIVKSFMSIEQHLQAIKYDRN